MKKALVLIDYENLYMCGMDQGLQLTNTGLEYFVSYLNGLYEIEDGMITAVCRFRDYPPLFQNFLQELSIETVNAIDEGKDVADGYLIVEGIRQLMENNELIEEVVIVSGDNVYAGLIRNTVNRFRKSVRVISWKQGLSTSLTKINQRKVNIEYVEDIFEIGTGNEFNNKWFENDDCSDLEKAVISFIANSKFSNGFHLNSLANKMVESPDPRVSIFSDYHETRSWFISQTGQSDLFISERTERGIHIKLNSDNTKVQYVLNRNAKKTVE